MDISVKNKKTRHKIDLHRLNNIFYKNKLTKFNLLKNMVLDLLLYGNGYCRIEKASDGSAVGLTYLPAAEVSAFFNDNVDDTYFTYKGKRYLPSDLIHIFKNTYNGYIGVGIIQFARRSLDLANAAEDSALDFYDSGLNINGILHATEPMRKQQG
jgi:phage portal protein BeeE